MIVNRLTHVAAPAVIGLVALFATAGAAAAQTPPTSAPPTSAPPTSPVDVDLSVAAAESDSPVACTIVDSDVESGTATFTVGPADCSPQVGPISFSTYDLPGGQILPYSEQTLIDHADTNGAFYGAGSYTLTASLGQALNWQADLYYGASDDQPPHPNMIDVDAQTGVVAETTTTTTSTTTSTTTTAPPTISPAAATAPSSAPVDTVASLTPVPGVGISPAAAPVTPGGSTAVVAPTTTTAPIQQLPATGGGSATGLLVMAGALTVIGWATLRLARRTV